ncbi:MAG: lipopolysaccharide heptosyltransferase family protein [Gammaproteobacteria bacterium]|nr:lipopolysaccharide heptosyltransferase family protein [Gammaproteobacteria bacterium]
MATERLLLVRNDKLGDFMLAWPAFALIKHYWPELHITALVPEYTAEIARLCPWIDELLIDHGEGTWKLSREIKGGNFSAVLTLFSTGRVALASLLAGVPYRLAPATKIAQLCYNHRLTQRRSHSKKPEYLYNTDLAYQLLQDFNKVAQDSSLSIGDNDLLPAAISRPLLKFDDDVTALREQFITTHNLDKDLSGQSKLIFIHPGSGGSANNLSIVQFSELARKIAEKSKNKVAFVITAGPGEENIARELIEIISANYPATLFKSDSGIEGFARTLQIADLFISGSTGTLHIAGAMNCNTAGFYPRHRSATPLRWQTLNSPERRLAFTPPDNAVKDNLSTVEIDRAAIKIVKQLL